VVHLLEGCKKARLDAGMPLFQVGQELFNLHPFVVRITACGTGAAGNGKTCLRRIGDDVILGNVNRGRITTFLPSSARRSGAMALIRPLKNWFNRRSR